MNKSRNAANPNELRSRAEQMASWLVAPPLVGELDVHRLMHELQVHQVELEMQNAELRHARTEVDDALKKANVDLKHLRERGIFAKASGDMTTLLGVINDMSQQLRASGMNAEQSKRLNQLDTASKKLAAIVHAAVEPSAKPARELPKKRNN